MTASAKKNRVKKKNPLYVVTNKGQDVEEVGGLIELVLKKLGLTPLMDFFTDLVDMLLSHVTNFAMFLAIQKILDEFFEAFIPYLEKAQSRLEGMGIFSK